LKRQQNDLCANSDLFENRKPLELEDIKLITQYLDIILKFIDIIVIFTNVFASAREYHFIISYFFRKNIMNHIIDIKYLYYRQHCSIWEELFFLFISQKVLLSPAIQSDLTLLGLARPPNIFNFMFLLFSFFSFLLVNFFFILVKRK